MKILLAADGSKYTKRALAFVVNHEKMTGTDGEIVVLNVQSPVPPRVKAMIGATAVTAFHKEDAQKVLDPIEKFLRRHGMPFRTRWVVGPVSEEIIAAAKKEKSQLIVMGTRGQGVIGRALMGSVAQRVITDSSVPVLLVK
jgi:nucleotide-binding universal stress UspA family protein